jgi:hypothetical protein
LFACQVAVSRDLASTWMSLTFRRLRPFRTRKEELSGWQGFSLHKVYAAGILEELASVSDDHRPKAELVAANRENSQSSAALCHRKLLGILHEYTHCCKYIMMAGKHRNHQRCMDDGPKMMTKQF